MQFSSLFWLMTVPLPRRREWIRTHSAVHTKSATHLTFRRQRRQPRPTRKKTPEAATPPAQPAVTDPHQAQIIADTQKLLKLSQELKAEVAKSNKDTLSLTVIKKAEEVEKLAKTLKDELNKSH